MQSPQTGNDIYIVLSGTHGDTDEMLFSQGLLPMAATSNQLTHPNVGELVSVTVRLAANDGFSISELDVQYGGGADGGSGYVWPTWM
eukprot:SAG31_NODE_22239_length_530_cov_1.668213_2_plen_86_part_01